MTTLHKILIGLGFVLLTSALIFFIYKNFESGKQLNDIQTSIIEQKQLIDNITRSSAEWASKDDFDKLLKSQDLNLKAIQKDIDSLNGKITGIQTTTVVSDSQATNNVPTTTTTVTDNTQSPVDPSSPDPFGYLKNTQHLTLNEKFGDTNIPIGDVAFSASKDKPWTLALPQRTYNTTSVLGVDSSGKPIAYTKFTITSDGKTYDVNIKENKVVTVYPTPSMSWFNPHLQLQIGGGAQLNGSSIAGEAIPSIGVMFSSYGKTKSQPDLQFLGLGVGYGVIAKKPDFTFTPIQINVSKVIPWTTNLFVGPAINVNTSGNFGAMLQIGVNL